MARNGSTDPTRGHTRASTNPTPGRFTMALPGDAGEARMGQGRTVHVGGRIPHDRAALLMSARFLDQPHLSRAKVVTPRRGLRAGGAAAWRRTRPVGAR